ncbi:MAG: extracellular solute-binding protein [Anaerolineae bacterium]|nr:extracellular solute-binding protein [Anaerolineae bacterium]
MTERAVMERSETLKRLLFLCLSSILLLAGCLNRPTEETIALTWWITFAEDSAEYPAFQAIAEAFEAQTGYKIELVLVPWSDIAPRGYGSTRLMIAQKEGSGPDLWGPVPHNWTAGFVAEEQVLALDRTRIENAIHYLDAALWSCQVGDAQYGLPVLFDSVALIYNKKLVAAPPKSFDELLALARAQTDPEQDHWGLVLPLLSQYHTYPFIEGYGGYAFRCERAECNFDDIGLNSEGAVRGVQLLSDLYLKEKLFPEPLIDRAVMNSYALNLFTAGRAAMLIDGPWVVSQIEAAGVDYGVASLPALPGSTRAPRPFTVFQAMYVAADTAHADESIALINYVASQRGVEVLQAALGRVPVRRDIIRSAAFRANDEVQGWYDQAVGGVLLPSLPEMDSLWYPWGYALEVAVPGLVPVQDALDQAVSEFKGYFKE